MRGRSNKQIGKKVIIRIRPDSGAKFITVGNRRHPVILNEINNNTIKITDIGIGTTHEIKKSNIYLMWVREEKEGWLSPLLGPMYRYGDVIYANEDAIRKRHDQIEDLDAKPHRYLNLAIHLLLWVVMLLFIYKFTTYIKAAGPLISSLALNHVFVNAIYTVIQSSYPLLLPLTILFELGVILSTCTIFYILISMGDIIDYPINRLRKRWLEDYISLLEYKSNINMVYHI